MGEGGKRGEMEEGEGGKDRRGMAGKREELREGTYVLLHMYFCSVHKIDRYFCRTILNSTADQVHLS